MKFFNGGLFQSGGGFNYVPAIVSRYSGRKLIRVVWLLPSSMIEMGLLQKNLENAISFNGNNLDVLAEALQQEAPELEFIKPTGIILFHIYHNNDV